MILEWFVNFIIGVVTFVSDLLPTVELPAEGAAALAFAMSLNGFLPIAESLAVVSLSLTILAVLFSYRVMKILLAHIPGIGGTG